MVSVESHLERLGGDIQPRDELREPTLAVLQTQPSRFELLFHRGGDLAQEATGTRIMAKIAWSMQRTPRMS
jgi:hypothetical protein